MRFLNRETVSFVIMLILTALFLRFMTGYTKSIEQPMQIDFPASGQQYKEVLLTCPKKPECSVAVNLSGMDYVELLENRNKTSDVGILLEMQMGKIVNARLMSIDGVELKSIDISCAQKNICPMGVVCE